MIDLALPHLEASLNTELMSVLLERQVFAAYVVRHKPGKRALVRYDTTHGPLLGKMRSGHRASSPYRLAASFESVGFGCHAEDGIRVASPIAVFDQLDLWVQRLVPGTSMGAILESTPPPDRATMFDIGSKAAQAAFKIHRSGVATRREHNAEREVEILRQRFAQMRVSDQTMSRLHTIVERCEQLVDALSDRPRRGIHRDFYPDQLLVDDRGVTVVDFDLYCAGDPATDIGNFIGHVYELGIRCHGDAGALDIVADSCRGTYLRLAGESHRAAIEAYTTMTLARHVSLSRQIPGRKRTTGALIRLTERRLATIHS